jgi:AcrR family transcriptional regulator
MPRKKVITADMLLEFGFKYLNTYGYEKFTARDVVSKFGISTQPIYGAFKNMDCYKQAVLDHVFHYLFDIKLTEPYAEDPFVSIAIAFIRFSEENPNLYRALFVEGFAKNRNMFDYSLKHFKQAITTSEKYQNLSEELMEALHSRSWIIVNGMASASIAGIRSYDQEYLVRFFNLIADAILKNPALVPISR